ncbi:hypothetical protein [Sulfobacillus harzensis]|uniref:Heme-copper oxidase subunit III family profile domain-containing protein n=1 Tax=Sulfobacillus harzensis TaxID=2729629 RepID=A0A7Y0L068_9FIRM|nr:hypothetical protein [Sulfobacillus harzensis]NMP20856.1 hypothetical protein [Sulfobacillus harzensis]
MAMQQKSNGDLRAIRAGFGIFLISESVILVTLIAARYLTAGGNVGPYSQWLGAITTLFILISGFAARAGRTAIVRGNNAVMQRRLGTAFWFGVLSFASVLLQWILLAHNNVPPTLPTAEAYYVITGIWMLIALVSGFVLYAAPVRGRRIGGYTVDDHWDVDAATYFWSFTAIAWIVFYVVLYFL